MSDEGPYDRIYTEYAQKRGSLRGYEFQHAPGGSAPIPTVTFTQRLKWWTWDRWRRMKRIRAERDRRVEEILDVKTRRPE